MADNSPLLSHYSLRRQKLNKGKYGNRAAAAPQSHVDISHNLSSPTCVPVAINVTTRMRSSVGALTSWCQPVRCLHVCHVAPVWISRQTGERPSDTLDLRILDDKVGYGPRSSIADWRASLSIALVRR
jgi:hypothetical protein